MRFLTGIQPSGSFHIGNYFGALRPLVQTQDRGEVFAILVDLHALTSLHDAAALRENLRNGALDWLACGLDPARSVFFRQSDVAAHAELMWLLLTVTPMGLLERAHAYKDKVANGLSASAGLFTYPVLQAADILLYDADVVPVGKDQKQHLEIARDIAVKMNEAFGGGAELLKLPEPEIPESVAVVPGTDGRKMSKSYGNTLDIFAAEAALRKRVMAIVTDSAPIEAPKDPETNTVYQIYRLVAPADEVARMADELRDGGVGYGELKKRLFAALWEYFAPMRARRAELAASGDLDDILADGARRARDVAGATMARVRKAVGLD